MHLTKSDVNSTQNVSSRQTAIQTNQNNKRHKTTMHQFHLTDTTCSSNKKRQNTVICYKLQQIINAI